MQLLCIGIGKVNTTKSLPVRLLDKKSYIDTVTLRMAYGLSKEDFDALRDAADGRIILKKKFHGDNRWSLFFTLHQPSRIALEWLCAYEGRPAFSGAVWGPFNVVRVDVALDLIVSSASASALATRYLQGHLMPVGRHRAGWEFDPNEDPLRKKSTLLNEPEPGEGARSKDFRFGILGYHMKSGVRTAVYGDLPSKVVEGAYCAHIECRVLRARALGFHKLKQIRQLIELDHRAFWQEMLKLAQPPDIRELGRVIAKRQQKLARTQPGTRSAGAQEWQYTPDRMANVILRSHWDQDERPNAHNLLLRLKKAEAIIGPRAQRLFAPIEAKRLLPISSTNALWER